MNVFFISMGWLLPALIAMGVWDERYRRIPNRVLLVLLLLYLAAWPVLAYTLDNVSIDDYLPLFFKRLAEAGGVLLVSGLFSLWRPESLGMGDCKLMAVVVLYLGFMEGITLLWLALFLTGLRGLVQRIGQKEKKDSDIGLCSASCRSRYSILSSPFGMEDTIEMGI